MDDYLSIEEAASQAGISTRTVQRWLNSGQVEAFSFGGDRRKRFIRRKDLERLTAPRVIERQARPELQAVGS